MRTKMPQVDYCASKFACVGLDEALRVETLVQGNSDFIKTTVVCPAYINTGMFDGVQSKIIQILDPQFVADQVVDATLSNKAIIMVPSPAMMKLSTAFGSNCSMDQFTGRDSDKKNL